MVEQKFKSFLDSVSSLKLSGIKTYFIVDIIEKYAGIAILKNKDNPLRMIYTTSNPEYKIIEFRDFEFGEDTEALKREIDRLVDKHRIDNSALVLILNKYKQLNISLSKEALEDTSENSVEELIYKQLPGNINKDDFVLNYEKWSEDESSDNYIITITRKQEIEKYFDAFVSKSFYIRFAVPFIYPFSFQRDTSDKISHLVDFQKGRISSFHQGIDGKIFEDDHFLDTAEDNSEIEIEQLYAEKVAQVFEELDANSELKPEGSRKYYINTRLELNILLNQSIAKINPISGRTINYLYDRQYKHILTYNYLFRDNIFDYLISSHFPEISSPDTERKIVTRLVIAIFGLLFCSLILLNSMNLLADDSLSGIAAQNESRVSIEKEIKNISGKNELLKSDIGSLKQIKYQNKSISRLLKTLSLNSIDNLALTDIQLTTNSSGLYSVNVHGESDTKDAVIDFIRNLEGTSEFTGIELIRIDKKNTTNARKSAISDPYVFSINLIYYENKNS